MFGLPELEESLRKVAEGKLSLCLEIIYNARIPTNQALRIIGKGMKTAAQATNLKPKYHQIYHRKTGLIGVMLEFAGKSMASRIETIIIDFTNQFISEVNDEIKSFGMQIFTPENETIESLLAKPEMRNQVGLYILLRFLPSCRYQTTKKITKRIFKINGDKFMLVHDRSYDC
jgi:hypothetical protein